jgi:hypothetical protein
LDALEEADFLGACAALALLFLVLDLAAMSMGLCLEKSDMRRAQNADPNG